MNRNEAREIAEKVTPDELKQMFLNAQNGIKNWNEVSVVNKGMTKGTAFNILSKGTIDEKTHIMAKQNMVREFGEFLPGYEKKKKPVKQPTANPVHQEPNLLDDLFF